MSQKSQETTKSRKNRKTATRREASRTKSDGAGGLLTRLFGPRYTQTTIPGTDVVVADTSKVGVIPVWVRILLGLVAIGLVVLAVVMIILGGRDTVTHKEGKTYPYSYFTRRDGSLRVDVDGHKKKGDYRWRAVCDKEELAGVTARKKESGGKASFQIKPLKRGNCRVRIFRDDPRDHRDVICIIDFDLRITSDGKGNPTLVIDREESSEYDGLITGGEKSGLPFELWPIPGDRTWRLTTKGNATDLETSGDAQAFWTEFGQTDGSGKEKLSKKEMEKAEKKGELAYQVTVGQAEATEEQLKKWGEKGAEVELFVGDIETDKAICLKLSRRPEGMPSLEEAKVVEYDFPKSKNMVEKEIPKEVKKIAGEVNIPTGWRLLDADAVSLDLFLALARGDDSLGEGKANTAMFALEKKNRAIAYYVSKEDLTPLFESFTTATAMPDQGEAADPTAAAEASSPGMEIEEMEVAGHQGIRARSDDRTVFLWWDEDGRSRMISIDKRIRKKKLVKYIRLLSKDGE